MNSICFDTETTGLHPNGSDPDEILTISIIGRDGSVLLDERFRPTVKTEWPHASASASWWMPPTISVTSGRAGHTVRLPTRSRRLPCSDGSNNGS